MSNVKFLLAVPSLREVKQNGTGWEVVGGFGSGERDGGAKGGAGEFRGLKRRRNDGGCFIVLNFITPSDRHKTKLSISRAGWGGGADV